MDLLQSIILGLIQGTTEWLPISSTGHLRLAEIFLGLSVPLLFDVTLHVGTLLVTIIYFRVDIKKVLQALWHRDFRSEHGRLILPIIVGSIPTGIIALTVGNDLDVLFSTLTLLGAGLLVSGIVLLSSKFGVERKDTITLPMALLLGIMQGLSIVPSISRTALVIGVALLLGLKRDVVFRFSFLLSIPAVIGALGVTLYQGEGLSLAGINTIDIIASLAVTVAISFLALKLLYKTLAANKFYLWSIYCFALGAVLVVLSLWGF
jgi:undecaprenyl-diphosphatase